ncbi:MAG: DNA recombination protein RmuC [Campylobacterota bacterium]|nr:DNA recombination protein RmuC [Campylobacterota bacterium]
MQIEFLIGIIICIIPIGILYKLYNKQIKKTEELKKYSKQILSINQKNEIELAKLYEKNHNLVDQSNELKKILDDQITKSFNDNEEIKNYKIKIATLETTLNNIEENNRKQKNEFKNIAEEIFENNSKKFNQNSQNSLEHLLNPMNQQLKEFKQKVEDVHFKDSIARAELKQELKMLKELNQQLSDDAYNLTKALKSDNKKQGNWGEVILKRVLENSGLREGYEFDTEVSLKDHENNSFRPDVVVHLPNNRDIIIDAKTSLTAYNEYCVEDDVEKKQIYLNNHIKSIKSHVKLLSNKRYENLKGINSLDFVFMFISIEAGLLLALQNDTTLYDDAFKEKIILVSPTTLLVALRAVENTWRYEKQAKNIEKVYNRAEELYKKFYGFVDDFKKVEIGLKNASQSYDIAFKKLSTGNGNLIKQVGMLKDISNIKPKKDLEQLI